MADSYFTGDRQFWGDPDFRTTNQIVVYAMLWQSPTTDIAGVHRRNDDIDCLWCRLKKSIYVNTLAELEKMGKIQIYGRHIWVKPAIWYNLYQGRYSQKQVEAIRNRLRLTSHARLVADVVEYYKDKYGVAIPIPYPMDTLCNGYPSESESESETESESESETESETVRRLVLMYLRICNSLPGLYQFKADDDGIDISKLSPTRRRHLLARWRENPSFEWWDEYFRKIEASDFLTRRRKNDRDWIADFDFILKPTKRDSIMEGKYDNARDQNQARHPERSGRIDI